MLPKVIRKELMQMTPNERYRVEMEVMALPFGDPARREWLVALCTAYNSWDHLANRAFSRPTLLGLGNPVSDVLAAEYDAYHKAMVDNWKAC